MIPVRARAGARARVALGCMRLDAGSAEATIRAALDAGIACFDTARAYANERQVAAALGERRDVVRIVTKGGMARPDGGWRPDGRARTLLADAEASAEALGRPPDVWLLHAPDPRTPLATSLRAVRRILDEGLARAVGVSNVTRAQLDEAVALAPITVAQLPLSPFETDALRSGLVARCAELGIEVLAHSPLGGPRRAGRLARDRALVQVARRLGCTPAELVLAWLQGLGVVPVVGARTPEAARSAARASAVALADTDREALAERLPVPRPRPTTFGPGEVVLIMGIPGAGKTRAVAPLVEAGYHRLNRDERGGTLRGLALELDRVLAAGQRRVVLDNTFLTRAVRARFVEVAHRHAVEVRCVFMDTPPEVARLHVCERLVAQLGELPSPETLARSKLPGVLAPTHHARMVRELEPPSDDEGFVLERVPFARAPRPDLAAGRVTEDPSPGALTLRWSPGEGSSPTLTLGEADLGVCPHPPGPPICWCRPPLPGLVALWAARRGVDLARVEVVGTSAVLRQLAAALVGRHPA